MLCGNMHVSSAAASVTSLIPHPASNPLNLKLSNTHGDAGKDPGAA